MDTFVPETQINYPLEVAGQTLAPGTYRATITITYAGHRLTRVLPLTISDRSLVQAFGSRRAVPPRPARDGPFPVILALVAGLMLLLAGFTMGSRVRARRSA